MDAHQAGGLWLLREMWDLPSGLSDEEKGWSSATARRAAHRATVDALESYDVQEDVVDILERNMPVANTWGRVAVFDAIRACGADGE